VLVTQAQHTLGKLSLGVVSETAQTLRGILSFGAMPPFSFFFFGALWLFLILEPALAGCPRGATDVPEILGTFLKKQALRLA
jgi:hypothetical protein